MDPDEQTTIAASRERLQRFVDETSDDDLARSIDEDWTAAALLAHIAFWDRRTAWLVNRCLQGNCGPSPVDLDSINESALPQWSLIGSRVAAGEALAAAAEIDDLLPRLSAGQVAALRESKVNYNRSKHRNAHLDQIERVLQPN